MAAAKRPSIALAALAAAAVLLPASTLAASAPGTSGSSKAGEPSASARALLGSHELWATIDVCNPADQPDTVGIRGSMPGDGQSRDRMYMSFRLQYLNVNGATKRWVDLVSGATPNFVPVGAGASARQGGSSFQLVPVAGEPAVTLRGVVDFQWRSGKTIVQSAARATAAAHTSVAGADPTGYSAATCLIG